MIVISVLSLYFLTIWANPILPKLQSFNSNNHGRIAGGDVAQDNQFPYQVAISVTIPNNIRVFCSGALVSTNWVLTVAHCLQDGVDITLTFGSNSLTDNDPNRIVVNADVAYTHPLFDPYILRNDIALIYIESNYETNDHIHEISVTSEDIGSNVPATVSGWGASTDGGSLEADLRYINVTTISNTDCAAIYGSDIIFDETICAVGKTAEGACYGDSGAPLVIFDGEKAVLAGIVSFLSSLGCASGSPTGFTRISAYTDWIAQIISL